MFLVGGNMSCLGLSGTLLRKFSAKVVKSKVSNVEIPRVNLNDFIWKNLDKWHNKTALVCAETGRSYLYSDVYAKCNKISNFLINLKELKKGDVVATILPNVPEHPMINLGAIQAGLKITTINATFTKDEIKRQLEDVNAKVIFTLTELSPIVYNATRKTAMENVPVVLINHSKEQMSVPSGAIKFREILEREYSSSITSIDLDDISYIPYSSGTTGLPKGVKLTTRNLISTLHNLTTPGFAVHPPIDVHSQHAVLDILPMFHIYGMITTLFNLSRGSKVITITEFAMDKFIKLLYTYKPTYSYLVPVIIHLLANDALVKTEDVIGMGIVGTAAYSLRAEDKEKFEQKTQGKVNILEAYGSTETTGATHGQTMNISAGIKNGGVGLVYPNHECKIISATGDSHLALGPNQQGELLIRGPQLFKGYLNNAEATQSAINSEGWYHTGDLGYYDEDEHFYITGRLKEIIKVKGFQVGPAELEEVLRSHPDVDDAAVIGVPHPVLGEVPKAFIVSRDKTTTNCRNIQEYVASKVAKHKQLLGGVVVIDSIPKSATGKIMRKNLENH